MKAQSLMRGVVASYYKGELTMVHSQSSICEKNAEFSHFSIPFCITPNYKMHCQVVAIIDYQ